MDCFQTHNRWGLVCAKKCWEKLEDEFSLWSKGFLICVFILCYAFMQNSITFMGPFIVENSQQRSQVRPFPWRQTSGQMSDVAPIQWRFVDVFGAIRAVAEHRHLAVATMPNQKPNSQWTKKKKDIPNLGHFGFYETIHQILRYLLDGVFKVKNWIFWILLDTLV